MTVILKIVYSAICLCFSTIYVMAQDAEALFQKGNSLTWDGKYEEALDFVNKSLEIDSSLYQRYGFRAKIKANLGMYESAIEDITRCINKCNHKTRRYHVASRYLERAELHVLKNNNEAALEDTNKSISSNPNSWKAYNYRSSLLIKSGKSENALADLNKSIQINDNEASTYILRGKLRIDMGNIDGACSDFSKVSKWGFDEFDSWIRKNCN